jgi:hypothetical protein
MTPTSIRTVIESLSFRLARTMPEILHEYVIRSADNEAAYVALFSAIMEGGVFQRWAVRDKRYLYRGDGWKYWAMTTNSREPHTCQRATRVAFCRAISLDRTRTSRRFAGWGMAEHRPREMVTARRFPAVDLVSQYPIWPCVVRATSPESVGTTTIVPGERPRLNPAHRLTRCHGKKGI